MESGKKPNDEADDTAVDHGAVGLGRLKRLRIEIDACALALSPWERELERSAWTWFVGRAVVGFAAGLGNRHPDHDWATLKSHAEAGNENVHGSFGRARRVIEKPDQRTALESPIEVGVWGEPLNRNLGHAGLFGVAEESQLVRVRDVDARLRVDLGCAEPDRPAGRLPRC